MSNGSRTGATLAKLADTMALILWRPRSRAELHEVAGYDRSTLSAHLDALRGAGLIRVCGYTPTGAEIFEAQRVPFDLQDAQRRKSARDEATRNPNSPEPRHAGRGGAP